MLSKPISDHAPYVIQIGTYFPKAHIFRFENFWMQMSDFLSTVELHWNSTVFFSNAVKTLAEKFKQAKSGLKAWSKNISQLNKKINNCSWVIVMLDALEDQRILSRIESNFRQEASCHFSGS